MMMKRREGHRLSVYLNYQTLCRVMSVEGKLSLRDVKYEQPNSKV